MDHNHTPGCKCPACLTIWERRVQAGRQLFAILDLVWMGPRQALGIAKMIEDGYVEWLPDWTQERLKRLDRQILESLLRDLLE